MAQTRDLGVIETEAITSSRDPASIDVLGGLKGIGDDISEAATGIAVKNLSDDFDEAADEALEKANAPVEDIVLEGPETTGDADADALLTNIRTLQAGIAQASGSTQQRLQLELRKQAEDLGNRFPGMRTAIRSELSRFVTMDPEVAALAAIDVANAAYSKEAAADLAKINTGYLSNQATIIDNDGDDQTENSDNDQQLQKNNHEKEKFSTIINIFSGVLGDRFSLIAH